MTLRIGIDLGGTKIEGVVLDGGRETRRLRIPTPRDDYAGTVIAIERMVRQLEGPPHGPALQPVRRSTVGVGIPGALDPDSGLVKNANSVWLIGRPLLADLTESLGRPVRIANDANCFAISEATDGAAANAGVVFGAIVGTGTGAGVVVHGRLITGVNAIAGEWGHNPLPWANAEESPGPPCYCGRFGCIETFLSGPGLSRDFQAHSGQDDQPAGIVRRAADGDAPAEAALVRYETRMARALASVINLLDPDVIVLGGGMSNVARLYDNVPRLWGRYVFGATGAGQARVRTRLVQARHGDASGVRGAAWLWPDGGEG